VLASQARLIVVVVLEGERKLAGTEGEVVSGVGGVGLSTVTVMTLEVVVLPAASRAMALRVCGPLARVVVFQTIW
jgi:hypothetical protein